MPNAARTPSRISRASTQHVRRRRRSSVGQGQRVLAGKRHPATRSGIATGEPGLFDQPGCAGLDPPVGQRPSRRPRGQIDGLSCVEDGVGEEGAGTPRVVIGLVEHHALASAKGEDGLTYGVSRRALPHLDAQRLGKFRVSNRTGQVALPELVAHRQHDESIVRPGTGWCDIRSRSRRSRTSAPLGLRGRRCGPSRWFRPPLGHRRPRSASASLRPHPECPTVPRSRPALRHRALDEVIPLLPGSHGHDDPAACGEVVRGTAGSVDLDTLNPDPDNGPVETLVRDHHV